YKQGDSCSITVLKSMNCMTIQTRNGYPEVVLMATCDATNFYKTADRLRQVLGIAFSNKETHAQDIEWHFQFAGITILLLYNLQTGISLSPAAGSNTTPEEMAAFKN